MVFSTSIYPVFSSFAYSAKERLPKFYKVISKYQLIVSLAIAAGLFVLADQLVLLVFNKDFLASGTNIRLLCLVLPVVFFNMMFKFILSAANLQRTFLKSVGIGVLVNFAVAVVFIPFLKSIGACIAYMVSQVVVFAINYKAMSREIAELNPMELALKPFICALIMGVALFSLGSMNIFLKAPIGMLVYLAALMAFKTFSSEEIEGFKRILFSRSSKA